jgi:hypothetical protein
MSKIYRSKTVPAVETSQEGLPISWSLVTRQPSPEDGRTASLEGSRTVKLPKIKRVGLNEAEKDIINEKILKMKRMSYDPKGCSKSLRLEKVLLRKKKNRPQTKLTENGDISPHRLSIAIKRS